MLEQEVELIGRSQNFSKSMDFAKNIAVTRSPVLIVGEAGIGKKTFCHFIHQASARRGQKFLVVDCLKGNEEVEGKLLGKRDEETGAFHRGHLETAHGGTLVLANIDGLEEKFQERIYQVIQELPDYDIDIRILATTSKNIGKLVGSGRFSRALFSYFSNGQILLHPLRERKEDIKEIIQAYLERSGSERTFSEKAMEKMLDFYWTHNVAELISTMESLVEGDSTGLIDVRELQLGEKKLDIQSFDETDDGLKLMSLKDAEKLLIKKALIHTSENRTQAAKILGVSIRTLRNKINEYRSDGSNYFVNLR